MYLDTSVTRAEKKMARFMIRRIREKGIREKETGAKRMKEGTEEEKRRRGREDEGADEANKKKEGIRFFSLFFFSENAAPQIFTLSNQLSLLYLLPFPSLRFFPIPTALREEFCRTGGRIRAHVPRGWLPRGA